MLSPGSRGSTATVVGQEAQTALLESIDANILDIEVVLEGIDAKVDGLATKGEQETQTAHLAAIETATEATQAALSDVATHTEQQAQTTELQAINAELGTHALTLTTIANEVSDVATQTTLAQVSSTAQSQLTQLQDINAKAGTQNTHLDAIETATETTASDVALVKAAVQLIDDAIGTDNAAHGASQKGMRALGTDGTNDQQIRTAADGTVRTDPTGTTTQPVSGTVTANAGTGTFAISAASLPLPTNAATSVLQGTGNTSLASIDGKTPALGQAAMTASTPVVIANNQSAVPVSGTVTANAGTGTFTCGGVAAHDAPASGNPVLVGAYASLLAPADVADADVARLWASRRGELHTARANTTVDGTLGALSATVQISGEGASSVEWLVGPGLSGTIVFEESSDGTNWSAAQALQQNTVAIGGLVATSIAAFNVRGKFIPSGKNYYRLRVSAYTSGSLAARLIASESVDVVRAVAMGCVLPDDAISVAVPPVLGGGRASTAEPTAMSADGDMVPAWLDRRGARVVVGDLPHDGADAGNPVKIGGKASATAPASVAGNDRVNAWFNLNGAQFTELTAAGAIVGGNANGLYVQGHLAHAASDGGNPIKVGAKAAVSALPAGVTNAQRSDNLSDRYGRQLVEHVDAGLTTFKGFSFTTAQTGVALWTPASGKRVCILGYYLSFGGTTSGVATLWLGASADTTYTEGTDQVVWAGDLILSATLDKQIGPVYPPWGVKAITTDHVLRLTTSAGMTVKGGVYGYEFTP